MTVRSSPILIDSHCHLDFPEFDDDRTLILKNCQAQNINAIVVPGVCKKDWQSLLSLCRAEKILFPALGLHPCFIDEHKSNDLALLKQLCASESLVAIGEIGLDFFITKTMPEPEVNKDKQRYYFSEQLQIANEYQLPVLIHARKSHDEVIKSLKHHDSLKGIIHAYSGSYEQAKEYLKLGFKLGFGGAFTYPKATRLRSLISKLPTDAWVLETDAPDMSPVKHYGERNSPEYLNEIAQVFIELFIERFIELSGMQVQRLQMIEQLQQNTLDVLSSIEKKIGG
ncbi:MAG: TatD family hydrolase [Gammaproteobacteria bacterium]|nr:TatD family hydrolase [Gammaproteobacteria bacterium]